MVSDVWIFFTSSSTSTILYSYVQKNSWCRTSVLTGKKKTTDLVGIHECSQTSCMKRTHKNKRWLGTDARLYTLQNENVFVCIRVHTKILDKQWALINQQSHPEWQKGCTAKVITFPLINKTEWHSDREKSSTFFYIVPREEDDKENGRQETKDTSLMRFLPNKIIVWKVNKWENAGNCDF